MRIDHSTLEALHDKARRERAEAVHRFIVVPVIRFFQKRPVSVPLRSRLA
jgi:hypothetical protein